MNITVVRTKKEQEKVKNELTGELELVEKEVDEKSDFEVHPYELLSSVANRLTLAYQREKCFRPPPDMRQFLVDARSGLKLDPGITVQAALNEDKELTFSLRVSF